VSRDPQREIFAPSRRTPAANPANFLGSISKNPGILDGIIIAIPSPRERRLMSEQRLERIESRLRTLTILQQRTHTQLERIVQTLADAAVRLERALKALDRARNG